MSQRTNYSSFQSAIASWVSKTNLIKEISCSDSILPDVNEFFAVYKRKFKFHVMEEYNLVTFLQEFYPKFEFQLEDQQNLCKFDHIYAYCLLLHFSCVEQKDQFFHGACLNLSQFHQGIICKFLKLLMERQMFDKASLSVIMNEALMPSHVPPLKIMPNIQSGMTPPTPKSSMLNKTTSKIRDLETELMIEKNRVDEIELQYQEKLRQKQKEIDEMQVVNTKLRHEILEKESEMASMTCELEVNTACEALLKTIAEKTQLLVECHETINSLNAENEELSEKFVHSQATISEKVRKITELEDTINSLEDEIERQTSKNYALMSHVEGLNSFIANSRRLDESLEYFNSLEKDFLNNNNDEKETNNNNSLKENPEKSFEGSHHSPLIKKRSFSIDIQPLAGFRHRNRQIYRSTTYKESERYLSIADEIKASSILDFGEDEADEETQLSLFFDSLHEGVPDGGDGRRESVIPKNNKILEKIKEEEDEEEISPACSRLLSQLKKENESLRKTNETLALAQLAMKRPKRGFKLCVVS
ncbi:structural maintenance of chromosomes protein 2-like [Culicoides brevitarsis]|uniref:structural maintenance of chromosomes protein 2-like n=1 Tax=Culicoides brevitarsis TaxID=469753 RepID=UPI00307C1917